MRLDRFDPEARKVLVAARRHARAPRHRRGITATDVLAAVLADASVQLLLADVGIEHTSVRRRLDGDDRVDPDAALAAVGVDARAIRSQLADTTSELWRLRRSCLRPLRVTLDGPSAPMPFAGSGRKVLEVACWRARRGQRRATALDLLRGIVADGADPAGAALFAGCSPAAAQRLCLRLLSDA